VIDEKRGAPLLGKPRRKVSVSLFQLGVDFFRQVEMFLDYLG
jgi:hypothetical protein